MRRRPPRYPRRTVRIAIEHLFRKPIVIINRAEHDQIIILRTGKPCLVILRHDYCAMIERRAGEKCPPVGRGIGLGKKGKSKNLRRRLR